MAIIFLDVSYRESLSKNKACFNPHKQAGFLEESLLAVRLENYL